MSQFSYIAIIAASGGALSIGLLRVLRGRLGDLPRILIGNTIAYFLVCVGVVVFDGLYPETIPASLPDSIAFTSVPQMVWAVIALFRSAHRDPNVPRTAPRPTADGPGGSVPGPDGPAERREIGPATVGSQTGTSAVTGGLVRRHWRGGYSLGISVWATTIFGNALVNAARASFEQTFELEPEISQRTYQAVSTGLFVFGLVFAVWAFVGTWRSAARNAVERKAANRRAIWARVTQAWIAVAALRTTTTALTTFVALGLHWQAIIGEHPDFPPFSIRVMRQGTEAEISGGFQTGLARELVAVLRATPSIRVLHLTSDGGWIDEGEKVFRVVRRGGLDTFVPVACSSACTMAFAGGEKRWIGEDATLGFHAPGADQGGLEWSSKVEQRRSLLTMESAYKTAGFDRAFIVRALATPTSELLQPSGEDLLKFRVATSVATEGQFAASGWHVFDRESAARLLEQTLPPYRAISENFPDKFNEMVDSFWTKYQSGASSSDVFTNVNSIMSKLVHDGLSAAEDTTLVDYLKLLADVATDARDRRVADCVDIFDRFPDPYGLAIRSDELSARRDRLAAIAIRTAVDGNRPSDSRISKSYRRFLEIAAARIGKDEVALMIGDERDEKDYDRYCSAWIAAVRLAETLSPSLAADVARRLHP